MSRPFLGLLWHAANDTDNGSVMNTVMNSGMNKESRSMFDQPARPSADTTSPSADQQQLLRLNADFLRLLLTDNQPGSNLSPAQATLLAQCTAEGIQRMAGCGFSLFSLSLHRPDLWQHALQRDRGQDAEPYGAATSQDPARQIRSAFMECAVFFAWHLAQRPREARFMLGMADDCANIIARLELWQCRRLAHTETHLLSPRWLRHPYFWNDLLRYGSSGDAQHFKFACLLGSQLMAQDLEPSAILHLSSTE